MENLYGSESGLQLFGFFASPRADVINSSESRFVSLSHRSCEVGLRFLMIVVLIKVVNI